MNVEAATARAEGRPLPSFRQLLLVALVAALLGVQLGARSGEAHHNPNNWVPQTWSSSVTSIGIRQGYTDVAALGTTNSTIGKAARHAGNNWDNMPNTSGADTPNFDWAGTSGVSVGNGPCSSVFNSGEVTYGSTTATSGYAMSANICVSTYTGDIYKGRVRISTYWDWHWGAAANQLDLEGIFTHEFGHILGFGLNTSSGASHFGPTYCAPNTHHTLCENIGFNDSQWQSLEYHDRLVIDQAY